MKQSSAASPLILSGIDGGNPLGFLSALGAAVLASSLHRATQIYWCLEGGSWRPALLGSGTNKSQFIDQLMGALRAASTKPFEIDDKLPFSVELFETHLKEAQLTASPCDRRMADFLAAFGSEMNPDKGVFRDSRFRTVRSGDSAGQGLPAYARAIRKATDAGALERTLFESWDYQDDGFSLRWDPIEDQRYALRWRDPSKSGLKDGPGTMIGACSLAIEALQCFPTMLNGGRLATTGFHRDLEGGVWLTWPIWARPISLETIRSLLALRDLHVSQVPRAELTRRGVAEIYRSQRIQQNQYYSNFTSARPAC